MGENIFSYAYDEEVISRLCEELKQLNNKNS